MTNQEIARGIVDSFHKRGNTGLTSVEHDIVQALDAKDARIEMLEAAYDLLANCQKESDT